MDRLTILVHDDRIRALVFDATHREGCVEQARRWTDAQQEAGEPPPSFALSLHPHIHDACLLEAEGDGWQVVHIRRGQAVRNTQYPTFAAAAQEFVVCIADAGNHWSIETPSPAEAPSVMVDLLARLQARQEETDRAIATAYAALTDGDAAAALAALAAVVAQPRQAPGARPSVPPTRGAPTERAHAERAPHVGKTPSSR